MSLIPESSPIPNLIYNFSSSESILSTSYQLNEKILNLFEASQFSSDLQINLDLTFNMQGYLTEEILKKFEDFFLTAFSGLKSANFIEDFHIVQEILKKHKHYISFLGVSLEKLTQSDDLSSLMQAMEQQKALNTCHFRLYKLDNLNGPLFFNGLLCLSQKLIDLTLEFKENNSDSYAMPSDFWSSFPELRQLQLIFSDSNVPSALIFFKDIRTAVKLKSLSVAFRQSSVNKVLFNGFLEEMKDSQFVELDSLNLELRKCEEKQFYVKLIELIEKFQASLRHLGLIFSNTSAFDASCFEVLAGKMGKINAVGKLESLKLNLIAINFNLDQPAQLFSQIIKDLPESLNALELNLVNNHMNFNSISLIVKALSSSKACENLRSFLGFFGWNNINDENGRVIFKELAKLVNLEVFLCDLSQSYQGSVYMNGGLTNDFIEMIKSFKKLKTILINLEGNEFKENHYNEMETVFKQIKTQENNLKFWKIFRKNEIYGVTQSEPNLKYYLDYSAFLEEKQQEKTITIPNINLTFNNCFFKSLELIKNIRKTIFKIKQKTKNENLELRLVNPPFLEDPSCKYPLLELFQDNDDLKFFFSKVDFSYTSIFRDNEFSFPEIHKKLKIKQENYEGELFVLDKGSKEALQYLNNFNSSIMNGLLQKKQKNEFDKFCKSKMLAYNLSVSRFEEFSKMIPHHFQEHYAIFINQVFVKSLLVDIYTDLPSFILKTENYSSYLWPESLSLLLNYCKIIREIQEDHQENAVLKVHKEKIMSFNEISLKSNPNFSIDTWKTKVFKKFIKIWSVNSLKTPMDFIQNSLFETKEAEELFPVPLDIKDPFKKKIETEYEQIKEKLGNLDFPELNSYYQGFLEELISALPNLKSIDFVENVKSEEIIKKFANNEEKKQEEEKKDDEKKVFVFETKNLNKNKLIKSCSSSVTSGESDGDVEQIQVFSQGILMDTPQKANVDNISDDGEFFG